MIAAIRRINFTIGGGWLAVALLVASPALAADITWVSFHPDDDLPSAAAAAAGFTEAPDIGYTDLLSTNGHNVTRLVAPPAGDNAPLSQEYLDRLNGSDLVVISRSVNSGVFDNAAEISSWNVGVTAPILITGGYILRNNRLTLNDGDTIPDTTGPVRLLAENPGHPIFQGITLNGSNETANPYAGIVAFNGTDQRGISVNTHDPVGGTVIGRITSDDAAVPNGQVISEWPVGVTVGNGQSLGGPRMTFLTGSREADGLTSEGAGIFDLTALGEQLFLNAISYLDGLQGLLPGDVDGMNGVTIDDFNIIRDNFRTSVTSRSDGDLNGDGLVDLFDFRQWKSNFTPGSGASVPSAIPEPASFALALFWVLAGVAAIRRRHA